MQGKLSVGKQRVCSLIEELLYIKWAMTNTYVNMDERQKHEGMALVTPKDRITSDYVRGTLKVTPIDKNMRGWHLRWF